MTRDQSPTPAVEAIGRLHLEGNIIPHSFFTRREFRSEKGITQHLAILVYADDLYWYRPTYHRDELTGQVLHTTRKFAADKLQRTYAYYASLLGITKAQATAAVKFLVDRGLTTREFRTVISNDGRPIPNVMFVEPVVGALPFLLQPDHCGAPGLCWIADAPQTNVKKDEGEADAEAQEQPKGRRRKIPPSAPQRQSSPRATASATAAVSAALNPPENSKPVQVSGGVSQIDGGYTPNRTDTVSQMDGGYTPNGSDTNTEIPSETYPETSSRGEAGGSRHAPAAEPEHSSSGEAAGPTPEGLRDPVTLEVGPEPHAEELLFLDGPAAPVNPAELEAALARLGSPDGAAGDPPQKLQAETQLSAGQDSQATGSEQVPGGGAARPDWLEALEPVAGLLDRPAAEPGSPTYRALKALAGKSLSKYLGEKSRTGQLPRSRWLHLAEAEIDRVRVLAQVEAEASSENMITLALRGLDRLIGARKPEEPVEGSPPAAAAQDPKLAAGQRCTVADQGGTPTLGVVLEVNAARYKVRFDDGNGREIDRSVAAQLRTLKASTAPLPESAPEAGADAPLVPAGTTWRRVRGKEGQLGEQVTVQAVLGMKRTLSNGKELPVYVITRDFEQVV